MFSASLLLPIALSLKPMLASAQATTLSGVDTPTETYPATPLADKRFSYPSGIVRALHALHSFSSIDQAHSLNKRMPTTSFVVHSLVTTTATTRPLARTQNAKPAS